MGWESFGVVRFDLQCPRSNKDRFGLVNRQEIMGCESVDMV